MATTAISASSSADAQPASSARTALRIWLFVVALMIVAIILVGGATRLTDSGLSITEWKPIHGVVPPLNQAEWLEEFEKYKQIPEYIKINEGMSLDDFKTIYWWEWGHRLLGRAIGLVFAIPLAVFWLRGMVPNWMKPRLLLLLALGGLQGFIGWWMVTSGLVERTDVSQYRLAIHLTLAILILAYATWLFARLTPSWARAGDGAKSGTAGEGRAPPSAGLGLPQVILGLILVQIFLGGLVAGLDAGLTFNTWPLMDGAFVPDGIWIMSPVWINHFENVLTVQFQHRITAYLLLALVIWAAIRAFAAPSDGPVRTVWSILLVLTGLQALSGIVTLLGQVPLGWALVHQGLGSLVVVSAVIALKVATHTRQSG